MEVMEMMEMMEQEEQYEYILGGEGTSPMPTPFFWVDWLTIWG